MTALIATNLRRRPARAVLTALGMAIGVATIVALLGLSNGLKESTSSLAHLGDADVGLFQRGLSDPTSSLLPTSLAVQVARQPGVAEATPLQLVSDRVPGVPEAIVFGIDPQGFVARRLVVERGRRVLGPHTALVGDALADRLGVRLGGPVTIARRRFRVAAIYHSGVTYEDHGAILALTVTQALTHHRGEATTIAVRLSPRASAKEVIPRLRRRFPGTVPISNPGEVTRADPGLQLVSNAVVVFVVLALVLGGVAVANTMVLAVLERRRELALLAAVGWSGRQLGTIVLLEGLAISVAGAGLGLALGAAASTGLVHALGAAAFVSPDLDAATLLQGVAIGIGVGVIGGAYPAWRATRLSPARILAAG